MATFIKCKVRRTELVERKTGTYCRIVIEVPGSYYKEIKLGKAFVTQDDMISFGKVFGLKKESFLGLDSEEIEKLENLQNLQQVTYNDGNQ